MADGTTEGAKGTEGTQGAASSGTVATVAAGDGKQTQTAPAEIALKWADGVPDDFRNSYTEASKKLGLTGAHAQGVVDFLAARNAAMRETLTKQRTAEEAAWKQALEKHAELGGEKLQATMAARDAAQKKYASEGLVKLLTDSGYINHPEVVAHFARLGLANSEGGTAGTQSNGSGAGKPSLKDVYPNSPGLKF